MAIKSSNRRSGYAAWLLTKVINELTGNYFESGTVGVQEKPLKRANSRASDKNDLYAEECDRADGSGLD